VPLPEVKPLEELGLRNQTMANETKKEKEDIRASSKQ